MTSMDIQQLIYLLGRNRLRTRGVDFVDGNGATAASLDFAAGGAAVDTSIGGGLALRSLIPDSSGFSGENVAQFAFYTRRHTVEDPQSLQDGDLLCIISFSPYGATGYGNGPAIIPYIVPGGTGNDLRVNIPIYPSDNPAWDTPAVELRYDGKLLLGNVLLNTAYTVATLPAAATSQYQRTFVTDANSTTFNATVAGGGANKVPVWSDGTNWKIG